MLAGPEQAAMSALVSFADSLLWMAPALQA